MEESVNRLPDGVNLHDAVVTEIRFEGEKIVFEIPRGLVDDEKPPESVRPCRLQFTLDDIEIAYVSRCRYIFGKIRYFSTEISLKKLAAMLKKKKGNFQIVERDIKDYQVRFECRLYTGRKDRELLLKLSTHDLEFIED